MAIELPRYPVSIGTHIARQVGARGQSYRAAAARLREELVHAEAAWARAFDQEDARTAAQDRIDSLARRAKRSI